MLEVKHLTYEVMENGAKRRLVDDVSFSVKDGEMLVITGPNGGGKSTIAKLLMGIEKADGGEILLDGRNLSAMNVDERANAGIGYAFQLILELCDFVFSLFRFLTLALFHQRTDLR